MAERPPKRYDPGELSKTRQNLGELTPDEARKMAQKLGGQVGVERADSHVDRKYEKLADLNRRKVDHFVRKPHEEARKPPAGAELKRSAPPSRPSSRAVSTRPGYIDFVRMTLLAAQPEYQLQTFGSVVASFLGRREDIVNPTFIRNADRIVFTPIENLVLAVRQLLARNAKNTVHTIRVQYFQEILTILKDWDIEGISRELAKLQRSPRNVSFTDCRPLCYLIYRPIARLLDLEPMYHIAMAIKHVHDLNLLALPKDSEEHDKVKLQYGVARDMILPVFRGVRHRCYPMLLKLASVRFLPQTDLFDDYRGLIDDFLGLKEDEILSAKDLTDYERKTGEQESSETEAPDSIDEKPNGDEPGVAEESNATPMPPEITRGLELLDQLFPQAGFMRLEEYPDLYPYFHPLFNFPRGVELIPPVDPLQQVVVLIAILQELFYGFRAIRFKSFIDDNGNKVAVDERIEALTGNWHLFLDEVIGKNYAQNLDEFCRQIERNSDFPNTDYGDKIETDLLWTKRRYLLPLLEIRVMKGVRPTYASNLPKLAETLREVKEVIRLIIDDVSSRSLRSIENPWEDFSFAIENFVSKRFRLVVSRLSYSEEHLKKRISNVSLVYHTQLLLDVLDWLTSSPESFYYREVQQTLFRADPNKPGVPQYAVAAEDPYTLINLAERRLYPHGGATYGKADASRSQTNGGKSAAVAEPEPRTSVALETAAEEPRDRVTGMGMMRELTAKLVSLMKAAQVEGTRFVLLPISVRRFADLTKQRGVPYSEAVLKLVAKLIMGEIRVYADIPYRVGPGSFAVLLPETTAAESVHLAKRLLFQFAAASVEGTPLAVCMGIVEQQAGWSVEKLLKMTETAIREAGKIQSPAIVRFDEAQGVYVPLA